MEFSDQQIDSVIEIVTPENISFKYIAAGPFRRMPAFLIDVAIRGAVLFGVAMVMAFTGVFLGSLGVAVIFLLFFAFSWLYGGVFETMWNGQTPGKRIMGIRVLSKDGQPINAVQGMLRNILRFVDMMPILPWTAFGGTAAIAGIPTFAIGMLAPLLTGSKYQRLGDIVCGTVVVVEDRSWLFGLTRLDDRRIAALADYVPANFKPSRNLSRALATYVERRKFFSPARRLEISRHVAEPLLERFHLPRDTSYDLLLCALYHRAFVADQMEDQKSLYEEGENPFIKVSPQPVQPILHPAIASQPNQQHVVPTPVTPPDQQREIPS